MNYDHPNSNKYSLYQRYKEQENDVFTAERIIVKNDGVTMISKDNLMNEVDKVKKMLMNKIKAGQGNSSDNETE